MKRYLITGGLGFIGAGLVKKLVNQGSNVRVLDNSSRGAVERLGSVASDVDIVIGDIRDAETVHRASENIDVLCHLAYVNGTRFFYEKPSEILDVGVKGMTNVIDASIERGIGEFLLVSSSEVYQTPSIIPTPEEIPLVVPDVHNPRFSYGGGKIISELMAIHYGKEHFERVMVVRPHNVYGPNMGWEHVIPEFVLRMHELSNRFPDGEIEFPIQGSGKETRSFVFIDDFTEGLHRVLSDGKHLNIYHVGTEEEIAIDKVACEVGNFFGRSIKVCPSELQRGSTVRRCPDITKLKNIGFEPSIPFSKGLHLTAEWYVQNAHLHPRA